MRAALAALLCLAALASTAGAQQRRPPAKAPPQEEAAPALSAEDAALEAAIQQSGNDRAALVRNLESYLAQYPNTPRRISVYRALVEASVQIRDTRRAIEYAERLIALHPDDSAMMLFVVDLLERQGDDHSLTKATGYVSRVLDRVVKAPQFEPPEHTSQPEWQFEQKKLEMTVYLIRGRLEMQRRRYDAAVADLEASFAALPNAAAALRLGEIAELRNDYAAAIAHYTTAFVLPESYGAGVDGREVRRKLGNVWRLARGGDAGLGEHLLAAYDRVPERAAPRAVPEVNRAATSPYGFTLRTLEESPLPLSAYRGRVLVLNFWTTWCVPCREMEPLVERVRRMHQMNPGVVFLAVNADDDPQHVAAYLSREKIGSTVVFADGLDRFLAVDVIPTLIVLDRAGQIAYRAPGFDPARLVESLDEAIRRALAAN